MANLKLENLPVSQKITEIFDVSKKNLGFIPNMYLKMGTNTALLDSYIYAYNSFRANSGFTPVEQEVVFLTIAHEKAGSHRAG